jgi:plasmid stabilization system protein ParE
MKLRFADAARSELQEAALYLEAEEAGLGMRFLDAVSAARKQILAAPLAWHPLGQGLRRCHLKRFRYGLIYRIRGQVIEIIAVAHDSRRPGYWAARLRNNG